MFLLTTKEEAERIAAEATAAGLPEQAVLDPVTGLYYVEVT